MHVLGSSKANTWRVNATRVDMTRAHQPVSALDLPAEPQAVTIDVNCTAIVIIDMQNDFCHSDGWLASIGVDISPARAPIPHLAALLPHCRGASIPVIWLNWGNRRDRLNISPSLFHVYNSDGCGTGLGDHLPNGSAVLEIDSWSAAVVDELAVKDGDIKIDKSRMSGFWDTPLDSILRNIGVTTLLFSGVNVDQCVLATLQDANFLGYDCILLDDCCATTSPGYCFDATRYNVKQCFGFVSTGQSLVAALVSSR